MGACVSTDVKYEVDFVNSLFENNVPSQFYLPQKTIFEQKCDDNVQELLGIMPTIRAVYT